ncbi:MAG: hypothetical protein ACK48U_03320, partial [Planctomyces sp.]
FCSLGKARRAKCFSLIGAFCSLWVLGPTDRPDNPRSLTGDIAEMFVTERICLFRFPFFITHGWSLLACMCFDIVF